MTADSFIYQGATRPVDLGFDTETPYGASLFSNVNKPYTNNALEVKTPGSSVLSYTSIIGLIYRSNNADERDRESAHI